MALRTGNSSNYEEMLQIYGNDDRTGGSTSLWIDSNDGILVFRFLMKRGINWGMHFSLSDTDEEIQNIKEFGMLRIS